MKITWEKPEYQGFENGFESNMTIHKHLKGNESKEGQKGTYKRQKVADILLDSDITEQHIKFF